MADVYRRLVDALQDSEDAKQHKELPEDQRIVMPPIHSWKIIRSEFLPANTLMVSPDVFAALKKTVDESREFEPKESK